MDYLAQPPQALPITPGLLVRLDHLVLPVPVPLHLPVEVRQAVLGQQVLDRRPL